MNFPSTRTGKNRGTSCKVFPHARHAVFDGLAVDLDYDIADAGPGGLLCGFSPDLHDDRLPST